MAVAALMLIAAMLGGMRHFRPDLDMKRNAMSTWSAVGLMALVLLGACGL